MKSLRLRAIFQPGKQLVIFCLATAFFLSALPCQGDVVFIHDHKLKEYLIGEKDADLAVAYTTEGAMFVDKKTRYTGSLMRRIFGKVEENRETTRFLLDRNQIREIDWYRDKIIVYPFENLTDSVWIQQKDGNYEAARKILKGRYRVSDPVFSIKRFPEKVKINEYLCIRVEANLRLETEDLKKNAASVTLINQQLWISDTVPGFELYHNFHKKLAEKLGLDAARLGSLNFLLRYWKGSLDPIRESLNDIRGYSVKSILTVDGQYIKDRNTDSPKLHSFQVKKESVQLREIFLGKIDKTRFEEPAGFKVVISKPE